MWTKETDNRWTSSTRQVLRVVERTPSGAWYNWTRFNLYGTDVKRGMADTLAEAKREAVKDDSGC